MAVAFDFESLDGWLLDRAAELLPQWLSNGRKIGQEWCIGNLEGEPGQSLKINMRSGRWRDFATGKGGKGLTALWAARHQLGQLQAGKELAEKYGYGNLESNVVPLRPAVSDQGEPTAAEMPPADAPVTFQTFKHPKHGLPAAVYIYTTVDRRPVFAQARYELADGKSFAPWTWHEGRWRMKGYSPPRPLYGLHRLEAHAGPTILVEGEKAADALQPLSQRCSVLTWCGGTGNSTHNDWSVLRGREVILWPDADEAGFSAMQKVTGILLALGCTLKMIDIEGLPEGFDAADLIQPHTTAAQVNQWLKPRMKTIQRPAPAPTSVQQPTTIEPAVTVTEAGKIIGKAPEETASYAVASQYGLSFNRSGVHPNLANIRTLIEGRVKEGAWPALYYDEFLQRTLTDRREWGEHDTLRLTHEIQRHFGITNLRKNVVEDAISLYAYDHRRNSAQEWLLSLAWDNEKRLEQLFVKGFGAPSNPYTRAVGRCFMVSMAARVLKPGCQVDHLPVLEGAQGIRKTSALRVLGGEYHAECQESATGKDFYLVLAGKMLVEIAEFHAFKATEIERLNGVITCATDRYRAPFERRASDHPRSCVFAATTNRDDWNRDETGARRFWPIVCGQIDIPWIETHRLQLFAEAVQRYHLGQSWWDIPIEDARLEQEKRRVEDSLGHVIRGYCDTRPQVTVPGILDSLGLQGVQRFDRGLQQRVHSMLRSWGYVSKFAKDHRDRSIRIWERPGHVQLEDAPDEPY